MRDPKIKLRDLDGQNEAVAIKHFRYLIKPWLEAFTEDNWPTTADHLHELLHLAMIEEGAKPEWIAHWSKPDWRPAALPTQEDTP